MVCVCDGEIVVIEVCVVLGFCFESVFLVFIRMFDVLKLEDCELKFVGDDVSLGNFFI